MHNDRRPRDTNSSQRTEVNLKSQSLSHQLREDTQQQIHPVFHASSGNLTMFEDDALIKMNHLQDALWIYDV